MIFSTTTRTYRLGRTLVRLGTGLLFTISTIAACVCIMWAVMDIHELEEAQHIQHLRDTGFITKSAEFSARHRGFKECHMREGKGVCVYTKDGVLHEEILK
jgi:hypothetical protein